MGLAPAANLGSTFLLLLLLYLWATAVAPPRVSAEKLRTYSHQFGPFNNTDYNTLGVLPSATISNDALQVTPDSASGDFNLANLSGRVMLKKPFKLIDSKSKRVSSFTSSFLVNLYQLDGYLPGEGLAFVIAPGLNIPPDSYGGYLGLTNSTTDGDANNRLVAVELDTFKEDFDPDANHVGINVNSVRSKNTSSLTPLGFELAPTGKANFFNVWVEYDGVNKSIQVYIEQQATKTAPTPPRPAAPVLELEIDLKGVVNPNSYFGFSASTSSAKQLNCVLRWNLTVEYFGEDNSRLIRIVLGVGVPVAVLLVVGAAGLWYHIRNKRVDRSRSNIVGALKSLPGTPREFKFKDLKKATGNFDEKNKLGQGGYGVVYRGCLQSESLEMAVKWFSRESIKGVDDFLAELTIINRLRHKHLVRLLGKSFRYFAFQLFVAVSQIQRQIFFPQ